MREVGAFPDAKALHGGRRTRDRLLSKPVRADNPSERMAELGDDGFIEFTVDEPAGPVRVYALLWLG